MKMNIAIIRPEKVEEVQGTLDEKQIHLMTATDVRGCGSQRGYSENYRGNKGVIRLLSKVKLEMAVNEGYVEAAGQAIPTPARSSPGKIGDRTIFVLPLEDSYPTPPREKGTVPIGP